jgi:hypothetical protein
MTDAEISVEQGDSFIDLTPTWGEWGNLFYLYAVHGERNHLDSMHPDFAKAFSAAQAFTAIRDSLTDEQKKMANLILRTEMVKQGFPLPEPPDTFERYDRVLVRDWCGSWKVRLIDRMEADRDFPYCTTDDDIWRFCIRFEGNERLIGTEENPEGVCGV